MNRETVDKTMFKNHLRLGHIAFASSLAFILAVASGCSTSSVKSANLFRSAKKLDAKSLDSRTLGEQDFSSNASSATLTVWHDSYESAKAASLQSGKPILADFTGSDWCTWCIKLKKDVFDTAEFKSWARDNVVLLELDYPKRKSQSADLKKQNAALAKKYGIKGYPTVLLLTPEGEKIGKLGYQDNPTTWTNIADSRISGDAGSGNGSVFR